MDQLPAGPLDAEVLAQVFAQRAPLVGQLRVSVCAHVGGQLRLQLRDIMGRRRPVSGRRASRGTTAMTEHGCPRLRGQDHALVAIALDDGQQGLLRPARAWAGTPTARPTPSAASAHGRRSPRSLQPARPRQRTHLRTDTRDAPRFRHSRSRALSPTLTNPHEVRTKVRRRLQLAGFRREAELFALAPRSGDEGKGEGSASIAAPCPSPGGLRPPTPPHFRGARCGSQSTTPATETFAAARGPTSLALPWFEACASWGSRARRLD